MTKWILLIFIICGSMFTGFMGGAAWNAKQFQNEYDKLKANFDWLYEGQCGGQIDGRTKRSPKEYNIRWGQVTG